MSTVLSVASSVEKDRSTFFFNFCSRAATLSKYIGDTPARHVVKFEGVKLDIRGAWAIFKREKGCRRAQPPPLASYICNWYI